MRNKPHSGAVDKRRYTNRIVYDTWYSPRKPVPLCANMALRLDSTYLRLHTELPWRYCFVRSSWLLPNSLRIGSRMRLEQRGLPSGSLVSVVWSTMPRRVHCQHWLGKFSWRWGIGTYCPVGTVWRRNSCVRKRRSKNHPKSKLVGDVAVNTSLRRPCKDGVMLEWGKRKILHAHGQVHVAIRKSIRQKGRTWPDRGLKWCMARNPAASM
jgi:hypothetical protein